MIAANSTRDPPVVIVQASQVGKLLLYNIAQQNHSENIYNKKSLHHSKMICFSNVSNKKINIFFHNEHIKQYRYLDIRNVVGVLILFPSYWYSKINYKDIDKYSKILENTRKLKRIQMLLYNLKNICACIEGGIPRKQPPIS